MSHRFATSDGTAIAFQRWGESNPGPIWVRQHGLAASASATADIRHTGFGAAAIDFLKL